jgi:hypothetical protein
VSDQPTNCSTLVSRLEAHANDFCGADSEREAMYEAARELEKLRKAIALAYGHLWHVNNEPAAPIRVRSAEECAYEARKVLRDLLTKEERGTAIYEAGKLIGRDRE